MARIVSIADAFDAMTSTRAYRKGMPVENAFTIIGDELGAQVDARLGKGFLALRPSGHLAHIVGHSEPGMPLQSCPSCSAPIALRRSQQDGDYVYCRACGGKSRLHKTGDTFKLELTGQMGDASVLAPDSDPDLICGMVEEIAPLVF